MRRDGLSIREIARMFAPVAQHGAALLRSNGLPTTSERRSPASSTVHIKMYLAGRVKAAARNSYSSLLIVAEQGIGNPAEQRMARE